MFPSYQAYHSLARGLGLAMFPPDGPGLFTTALWLRGYAGGRPVSVCRIIGKHPFVELAAGLDPTLDLGLHVVRGGVVEGIKSLCGAVDVEVGDPAFDEAFVVRA